MQDEEETHFLNVDVDVWSTTSLQPLVDALGKRVFVHYAGPEGKKQGAHFTLAKSYGKDADALIRRLATLITELPPAARKLWDHAVSREFNVGVQGGLTPRSHEIAVDGETLKLLAKVRGRIVITIYGAQTDRPARRVKFVQGRRVSSDVQMP